MTTSSEIRRLSRTVGVFALIGYAALAGGTLPSFGADGTAASPAPAAPTPRLHDPAPAVTASATPNHPLADRTLTLAGVVSLGDDSQPSVWVKATDASGGTALLTIGQLQALGYRVAKIEDHGLILDYGQIRLVVDDRSAL